MIIDLKTGYSQYIKLGAAPTYIIHEGKILANGNLEKLRVEFNMPGATLDEIYISLTTRGQDE